MAYRVLIVEDQREISRLLRSALETIAQGLVVTEAPSGEEAILEARRTRIDLLVADFRLPGINGAELVKKFRLLIPDARVIMTSGVTDPRQLRQITDCAPDVFFPKPIPVAEFVQAVEQCLGLQRIVDAPGKVPSQPEPDEPLAAVSLGDLIVNLRKQVGAQSAILFNDRAQVVAQAGQVPGLEGNETFYSALVGLVGTAQKATSMIEHLESHLHVFTGAALDAILLPIDPFTILFLAGKGLADPVALPVRLDVLYNSRLQIIEVLTRSVPGMDLVDAILPPALEPAVIIDAAAVSIQQPVPIDDLFASNDDLPGDFLDIFNQTGQKTGDADSFWDSAVENGTTFSEPDKLTYEQALRLGLTPDSAQDK